MVFFIEEAISGTSRPIFVSTSSDTRSFTCTIRFLIPSQYKIAPFQPNFKNVLISQKSPNSNKSSLRQTILNNNIKLFCKELILWSFVRKMDPVRDDF